MTDLTDMARQEIENPAPRGQAHRATWWAVGAWVSIVLTGFIGLLGAAGLGQ